MKTKYGLWLTYRTTVRPLRTNGYSKERQTLTEISPCTKHVVAKGFRQIQGVDYDETFSPVVLRKSARIMLAIAAFYDFVIWQMYVKTAFLNGHIKEELYMVQPKDFVDPKGADCNIPKINPFYFICL